VTDFADVFPSDSLGEDDPPAPAAVGGRIEDFFVLVFSFVLFIVSLPSSKSKSSSSSSSIKLCMASSSIPANLGDDTDDDFVPPPTEEGEDDEPARDLGVVESPPPSPSPPSPPRAEPYL
jgi:hypothetical protein